MFDLATKVSDHDRSLDTKARMQSTVSSFAQSIKKTCGDYSNKIKVEIYDKKYKRTMRLMKPCAPYLVTVFSILALICGIQSYHNGEFGYIVAGFVFTGALIFFNHITLFDWE